MVISYPIIDVLQRSRLRSLHLVTSIRDADESMPRNIRQLVKYVVVRLAALANLTVDIPIDTAIWKRTGTCWTSDLKSPVQEINFALGATHTWAKSKWPSSVGVRCDAGISGSLKWTDEEYWQSVNLNNIGLVYSRFTACQQMVFWKRYHSQFLGFNPQTFFDCQNKSCHCHAMANTGRPVSRRSPHLEVPEDHYGIPVTLLDVIALTHAILKRGGPM
jgi:hypothetical protein